MWWEWTIVGLLLAASAVWLSREAVRAVRRLALGRGCGPGGCNAAGSDLASGSTGPRELLQIGSDLRPKAEHSPEGPRTKSALVKRKKTTCSQQD